MTRPPADARLSVLLLAVALGGAAGAVVRSGLTSIVAEGDAVKLATLAVNIAGSFALGLLPLVDRVGRSEVWRAAVGPGLLGGFTTLSAVNEQSRALVASGRVVVGGGYLLGSLLLCVTGAALAARVVARRFGP